MFKKILVVPCVALGVASLLGAASARADEDTKLTGRLYSDFTTIDQKNGGVKTAASGFGADVKRGYLIIDHKFDDIWSADVTTDFNYVGNDSETQVYIKKAYVQAKLSDAFIARAGSTDTPWVPFVEGLYGYRFLENTLIDRLKYGTSADWGLNVNGKPTGAVSYSVSLLNGGGYKNPTRTKQMDVEGRLAFNPMDGVTVAAGFYNGKLGKKVEGGVATPNTASRFDGLVAYAKGPARLGVEYFAAKNWNNVTTVAEDKADGFSVWASYDFNPMWGVFARGDSAKVSKDLNPSLKDEYLNAGFVSHPRKNIDVAFAYKHDKSKGLGAISTSNGTIGSATATGTYSEFGVWAQVSF